MKVSVDGSVFATFPGYVRHVVVATGLDNSRTEGALPDLVAALREAEAAVRSGAAFEDVKAHPRIASWREAFQRLDVNPNKCPPSIANLVKRVRSGAVIPFVSPLVCIFNVVSLHHVVPCGGDDLDKVTGDVLLGRAEGTETYVPLGQPEVRESPRPGEVVLMDTGNRDVFCRCWCWRNGDRSRIEPVTRRVAINVDALPPVTAGEGRAAADEVAALVVRHCGGEVRVERLDAARGGIVV